VHIWIKWKIKVNSRLSLFMCSLVADPVQSNLEGSVVSAGSVTTHMLYDTW